MSYETLIVDQSGPIATITLNRPDARNALDFAMRGELVLALDKQALNRAAASDLVAALEVEALSQGLAVASDDHREGVAAFFDKRPPKFSGS